MQPLIESDPWEGWSTRSTESSFLFTRVIGHISIEGSINKISDDPETWAAIARIYALSVECPDPWINRQFSDLLTAKNFILDAAQKIE